MKFKCNLHLYKLVAHNYSDDHVFVSVGMSVSALAYLWKY